LRAVSRDQRRAEASVIRMITDFDTDSDCFFGLLPSPEHLEQMEQTRPEPTPTLRIGTWNVEHASAAGNPQRLALIQRADADIWVLTETQDGLELGSSYTAVHSEPRPKKPFPARWVTIWSKHSRIKRVSVRDPIRTTAALYDTASVRC
jgi:hypothetical protein